MANILNSLTKTGMNLVTSWILKNWSTNVKNSTQSINNWVTNNQYMSVNPKYANTKTTTPVSTPVVSTPVQTPVQTTAPMTQNPAYANNQNSSRFVWFQNNFWVNNQFTQPTDQLVQQNIQKAIDKQSKKESIYIPTQKEIIQNYNKNEEQKYKINQQTVKDLQADMYKNKWPLSEQQLMTYYGEYADKIDEIMDLQNNLRPIVRNWEYVDDAQITQYYKDVLPEQQKSKADEKNADLNIKVLSAWLKGTKNRLQYIAQHNSDVLSDQWKQYLQELIDFSDLPTWIKKNYNIKWSKDEWDILIYALQNPEIQKKFANLQNYNLTDLDKATINSWWSASKVVDAISAFQSSLKTASDTYQQYVQAPVNQAVDTVTNTATDYLKNNPNANQIANLTMWWNARQKIQLLWWAVKAPFNMVWWTLQWSSDITTAYDKMLTRQESNSQWVWEDINNALYGWINVWFNVWMPLVTALFNIVWNTDEWKLLIDKTYWELNKWIDWVMKSDTMKDTTLWKFYAQLTPEEQEKFQFNATMWISGLLGKLAKKPAEKAGVRISVAKDAIVNALDRSKLASQFQIWVEKWLADENGKFQPWAVKRIVKEWISEFSDAIKENFDRYNEVVDAREWKFKPVDNTNLEDKRTTGEKVKSEIKNTAEAVKEKVSEVNDLIKEKYNEVTNDLKKTVQKQEQQPQQWFSKAWVTDNWLNQSNYTQENTGIKTKKLNSAQEQLLQHENRMNPKAIQTFEEKFWESYWQYMYDRWFTKKWESNLNDMVSYQKDLMHIKEDALNKIDWKFNDVAIQDMLEVLQDFYTKTRDRKNLAMVENYINQHNNGWLSMPEINKIRKKFQYDIRTKFYSDWNSEKIQLANNVYLAVKDFLDKTAKENWLDSLDEINREIMKVQHIIGWITYKLRWSSANNVLWLTDYITLASMVSNPAWLAIFLWKQALKTNAVMNPLLNAIVGWRWNAKNRITAEKMQNQLENIAKINDEKARNKALEQFYNTYIKPVKELSEYFDNSVEEFKRQFNESVEEWTLDNALPDLREEDVKSGKKNLVTSKNQVTIEVDEQGNPRRKGQISESDKRSEENKKSWYVKNDLTAKPKEEVKAKKEPKKETENKEEPKKEVKKAPKKKTEVTKKEEKPAEEPKTETKSDLKSIVWDEYYNWLEEQVDIINRSRKWIKEPITIDDLDIGSNIYLDKFEKINREKLKAIQDELSKLPIAQLDWRLTPKEQKILENVKSEEEKEALYKKWRKERMEKWELSDEEQAKIEELMERAKKLSEQRESYYNYALEWTKRKNAKDEITNTKNEITTPKEKAIAKEVSDNFLEKVQQDDLFNMPESEDIEAIDNELTRRQQEDLKNMPETEDVEDVDNKLTAKKTEVTNNTNDTVKQFKDKTDKLYQPVYKETPKEVEDMTKDYIMEKLWEADIYDDDAIVDIAVIWSRARWTARPDSDIDVVVELKDDIWWWEDALFDLLNGDEDRLQIEWVDVDINPILAWKTWTIDYFLKKAEKYQEEKANKNTKNIITAKKTATTDESKVDKIIRESEWSELTYSEEWDAYDEKYVSFKWSDGKEHKYQITNSELKELAEKWKIKAVDEYAEMQAKREEDFRQTQKVFDEIDERERNKPKNLVTNPKQEVVKPSEWKIQEIDEDTFFNDIGKNTKDHKREMFIYKKWDYFYPKFILPSWKILVPENTYWGEVRSEDIAREWLKNMSEEYSEANEAKKSAKLKELWDNIAKKYEDTLKRIESDNPMQEIRTHGDIFKYGMKDSQINKAKKEADANAEVWTFKKDVIDWKEWYRIFVSGNKKDALWAFYEPKTWKTYWIYRWPTLYEKPFTTKQVDRIEKFLWNVEKQLEKETKKEKVEKKDVITQEWLDNTKPDNDWVIELDSKSDEMRALRQWKESLIKEWKADGKYLQNYWWEKYPQYLAVYIKDWKVYEWRKWLEDQYMKTKQEAVDWLNQKEKDVEHEANARYNERDYEPLPKTISVEEEAEKAWPKRIAPDRVKWQQETYDKWLNNVKDVLKASPVKLYELWFKSDRSKAVQDIMSERKRIRELPEDIAEKQWNELAKSVYEPLVIKDISKWYRYPEDVTSKFPKAQMQKAIDARARYEKWLFTSFSSKDTRANYQYKDEIWAWIKSQDWKPVTQEQMQEIVDGIRNFGEVFWMDMKKFAEDNNIIYVHLHGWNPFLMWWGGKAQWGGMRIAWLYRKWADWNISVSLWWIEWVMEKWEDWEMKRTNVNATPEHELAHAVDWMLWWKLYPSSDIEILKKTMNKPSRLINYYNRDREIVARSIEQYTAKKSWKSRYWRPYESSQAYWNEENFEKYVKPIVEKNMKEKLWNWYIDLNKIKYQKSVLNNLKNEVTNWVADAPKVTKEQAEKLTNQLKKTWLAKDVKFHKNMVDFMQYIEWDSAKMQSVRHGSPYSFDKFDSSHMGEWEWAQAHWWGHYVAVNKGTAENYAKLRQNRYWTYNFTIDWKPYYEVYKTLTPEEKDIFDTFKAIKVNDRTLDEAWKIIENKEDKTQFRLANKILEDIPNKRKSHPEKPKEYYDEIEQEMRDYIDRYNQYQDTVKKLKERVGTDQNLYNIDIPDPVKKDTPTWSNYLEESYSIHWEEADKMAKAIRDYVKKNNWNTYLNDIASQLELDWEMHSISLRWKLEDVLWAKWASKFLEDLWYDGIHYYGWRDWEAYVIFNDDALNITDHIQYLKDADWEIAWAVTPDWTVHLIESSLRGDTPSHEFSHLLRSYAKENNPELFNAINKIAKEAPQELKDYVKNTYWNLSEDAFIDEVFAWRQGKFSGIKTAQKWYERMWEAIKQIWNNIKSKFWDKYADLDTFKDYANKWSEELMGDVDTLLKGWKQLKPKNLITWWKKSWILNKAEYTSSNKTRSQQGIAPGSSTSSLYFKDWNWDTAFKYNWVDIKVNKASHNDERWSLGKVDKSINSSKYRFNLPESQKKYLDNFNRLVEEAKDRRIDTDTEYKIWETEEWNDIILTKRQFRHLAKDHWELVPENLIYSLNNPDFTGKSRKYDWVWTFLKMIPDWNSFYTIWLKEDIKDWIKRYKVTTNYEDSSIDTTTAYLDKAQDLKKTRFQITTKPQLDQWEVKWEMYHVTPEEFENFREWDTYNGIDWNTAFWTFVTDDRVFLENFKEVADKQRWALRGWKERKEKQIDVDAKKVILHPCDLWWVYWYAWEWGKLSESILIDYLEKVWRFDLDTQKDLISLKLLDLWEEFDYDNYQRKDSYTKEDIVNMPWSIYWWILQARFEWTDENEFLFWNYAEQDAEKLKKQWYDAVKFYEWDTTSWPAYSYALFYPNKYNKRNVTANGKNDITSK